MLISGLVNMLRIFLVGLVFAFCGSASAEDNGGLQTELLAQTSRSWNGAELPGYPTGKPEVSIVKVTIPAGAMVASHKHPGINAGYLLSGELTVVTEKGETLRLKAGDAIVEVVEQWHFGRNEGESHAVIVVFYAGVQGEKLSIIK